MQLLRDLKLLIDDNSKDSCYYIDGNAEDCYFIDNTSSTATSTTTTSRRVATLTATTRKLLLYQARGDFEAGQEGHHELLGKAEGPGEDSIVPPPEPTQEVPPLPHLPLAGLA